MFILANQLVNHSQSTMTALFNGMDWHMKHSAVGWTQFSHIHLSLAVYHYRMHVLTLLLLCFVRLKWMTEASSSPMVGEQVTAGLLSQLHAACIIKTQHKF